MPAVLISPGFRAHTACQSGAQLDAENIYLLCLSEQPDVGAAEALQPEAFAGSGDSAPAALSPIISAAAGDDERQVAAAAKNAPYHARIACSMILIAIALIAAHLR